MPPKEESEVLLSNHSTLPPRKASSISLDDDNTFYQSLPVDDNGNADNDNEDGSSSSSSSSSSSFFTFFITSSGPPQVMFLSMLYALSMGSTVGIVPSIMTTQYAHIYHGLDSRLSCSETDRNLQACLNGNNDALTAASVSSFVSNMIAFLTASLVGSLSDEFGRRRVLIVGQSLALLFPLFLVLLQLYPMMNPAWFYAAQAGSNLVSWITIALSAIADVIPHRWRASCFGLVFCGFYLGFALSPILAIPLSHLGVSLLSLTLVIGGCIFSVFFLPETLSKEISNETRRVRRANEAEIVASMVQNDDTLVSQIDGDYVHTTNTFPCCGRREQIILMRLLFRPFREISILNRNTFFRLLSTLAFFSGMSTSADQTLLLYYVEQRLGFNDTDVAYLFMILGLLGIIVQGFLLNRIIYVLGERMVIVTAFFFGALNNTVYAFASEKRFIYIGATIGCMTGMAFPTISAIKANNVDEREQGQIQGALYALSSLASALGPATFRLAYQKTENTAYPGSFFLVATAFFFVATVCALALPKDKANSDRLDQHDGGGARCDINGYDDDGECNSSNDDDANSTIQ